MILGLLLAAAVADPPVYQAERAFAAAAQMQGQWAAFRAFAGPGAIMLAPDLVRADALLPKLKEPVTPVMWWPAQAVTSCDGRLALSTGPWRRDGGRSAGRFFTIWQKQPDGQWKWIYDGGSEEKRATPAGDRVETIRAACGKAPSVPAEPAPLAGGASPDGSLRWRVDHASAATSHRLRVSYRAGGTWVTAVDIVV